MKMKQLSNEDLIQEYLDGNRKAWPEFIHRYSTIIYNLPRIVYGFDEEEASAFFRYALNQIMRGAVLEAYSFPAEFQTWFSLALRSLVLEFLRQGKGNPPGSMLNTRLLPSTPAAAVVQEDNDRLDHQERFQEWLQLIHVCHALETLPPEAALLLKLQLVHYFNLTTVDLELVMKTRHGRVDEFLNDLHQLRKRLRKQHDKQQLQELRLEEIYFRILHMERRLLLMRDEIKRMEQDHNFDFQLLERLDRMEKTLEQVRSAFCDDFSFEEYDALLIRATISDIAELLGTPQDCRALKSGLVKAQKALYKALERTSS